VNLKEAYKVLEADSNISDEDLKSHYKKLAVKYHPDVYKEDPEKFKKINEAYQFIQENKQQEVSQNPFQGFSGFDFNNFDFFQYPNNFGKGTKSNFRFRKNPNVSIHISFKESVLGCSRDIKYTRHIKCDVCDGKGIELKGNGCQDCDGFGRIVSRTANTVYTRSCQKCLGHNTKKNNCKNCNTEGSVKSDVSLNINVPPGVANGNSLRLSGMGNFNGVGIFGEEYSDILIAVSVKSDPKLSIEKNDVVSYLDISLLDALKGCSKKVETAYGEKEIEIKEKSKHSDTILIPNCGIKGTDGKHRIILNVNYPENINDLIKILEEQKCLS
jgi:molecular chaperone DnaJ